MELKVQSITAPMRAPMVTGHGTVADRELLLVTLTAADGAVGYGEAAPLESYDDVSTAAARAALEACRPVLERADGLAITDVLARCSEVALAPQALAAIDLALWDMAGLRADRPVSALLGATAPEPIEVNWTLSAPDRAGAVREASEAVEAGFRTLKAKVAIGDDSGRLAAVRAVAGRHVAIRIDANGAWSLPEAQAALRALAPIGIELCEEPVDELFGIRALRGQTEVPLALDESAGDPDALANPAADLLCLKIGRCGGISGMLAAAQRARAAGYEVYIASTLDGPLGIAAALHAAAVIAPARACGLATLALFEGRSDPLPPSAGTIAVPSSPGLGDGLADWYWG